MPPIHHKHPRLPGRDYTRGTNFVTFNTERKGDILGHIVGRGADAQMELSDAGHIVNECFQAIPDHHPNSRIAELQIMPDHLHAIVVLDPKERALEECSEEAIPKSTPLRLRSAWVDGAITSEALGNSEGNRAGARPNGPKRGSLGAIIEVFKSESTKRINALKSTPGRRLWKKGYHERVIRAEGGEYYRIAQYITENPNKWQSAFLERASTLGSISNSHWSQASTGPSVAPGPAELAHIIYSPCSGTGASTFPTRSLFRLGISSLLNVT